MTNTAGDKTPSSKEKILIAAERLFYDEGIQSVGIDRIIQEAGVAMNTLYKHFPSKDALVEQYLRDRDVRWRRWFMSYTRPQASLAENLLSLFEALNDWFHEAAFRGCAFINAAGEFGDSHPDVFQISREHKELIYRDVLRLCVEAGIPDAETLARRMMILIEGAIVRAYLNDDREAAVCAKEVAAKLLPVDNLCEQGSGDHRRR
ncbi:MAG: TetR/AcrR family transcriptional regulator [Candidatus Adiutrix sp.]|nr:TetR/AcrR family transcriptional regulator [Candidatus Adiutrix sp.]